MLFVFAFRPIYFVGNVLYYQLNIDYIIETYCINKDKPELKCNGKCHLTKQLQMVDNSSNEEKQSFNLVYEAFYPLFFQLDFHQAFNKICFTDSRKDWIKEINFKSTYTYNCFQPPEKLS